MTVTAHASGTRTPAVGTFTATIATPGVVTYNSHGLAANDTVMFTTTGALPTGLAVNTVYYVRNPATNTFEVSATSGGASINTTGSQSGTHSLTSEGVLTDVAVAGTFTLHVDKSNMAAGDTLELRCYQMVLTGGTRRVAYSYRIPDAQADDDMIAISVPISNELTDAGSLRFTIKQASGTARAFPWKVLLYG
jgi:hypothetical protein